jgi:hypothetical protein
MATKLALLWPALLLLACPPRTAYADLIIHDPVVGATTATDDGVPVACDPALTINISTRFLPDGSVNWSCFPSLPGPNNYGPVWVAAVEDGGVYCDFTGCGSGRFGWHNVGGPLARPDDFGGLALANRVGDRCIVTRTPAATTLTIIDPPSIFAYLASWFAGDPSADFNADGAVSVQDIFSFIAEYLR